MRRVPRSTRCSPSAPRNRSSACSSRTSRGAGSAASRRSKTMGGSSRSVTSAPTSCRRRSLRDVRGCDGARSGADDHRRGDTPSASCGRRPRSGCREPRDDRPGQPVYASDEAPEPGETGLRPATLEDLELLVPACAAAHEEEIGIDPLRRDPDGFRWRTRAQIEEGRSWLWLDGRRHPLQGRGVGVDAARRAAAAGLGRSDGCATRLRAAGAARPLSLPARSGADGLPVRPSREHARTAGVRLDRDAPDDHVPVADLLKGGVRHRLRAMPGTRDASPSGRRRSSCPVRSADRA